MALFRTIQPDFSTNILNRRQNGVNDITLPEALSGASWVNKYQDILQTLALFILQQI